MSNNPSGFDLGGKRIVITGAASGILGATADDAIAGVGVRCGVIGNRSENLQH